MYIYASTSISIINFVFLRLVTDGYKKILNHSLKKK